MAEIVKRFQQKWKSVLQWSTGFLNMFFAIVHISLTSIFIYYTHISIFTKLITLQISHCIETEIICSYIVEYLPY